MNAFHGFSQLNREEREKHLIEKGILTPDELSVLNKECSLSFPLASHFIENAIGCFPLPLGLAVNFVIDGREYVIPMVIEETSIIAGASKAAKWIREEGEITTQTLSHLGIGQIQFPKIKDFDLLKEKIENHKHELMEKANYEVAMSLASRGGGVKDLIVRNLNRNDGHTMAVVHVLMNTCNAMGANIINQVCEFLKRPIELLVNEKVGLCILSNLTDTRLTQAKVVIRNIDPELGRAIAEASLFGQIDPYRAATNNKGVLNGIDSVLIATGNDWRAVEAGIHAYAALKGQYSSITIWTMEGNDLHGVLEAPIAVGIVGGVTKLHPVAKICLSMLQVNSAWELARIVAAVGLVQNLSALTALVTHGICKGHMKLHISNLILASDATEAEQPVLKQRLIERLESQKHIKGSDVNEILAEIRKCA